MAMTRYEPWGLFDQLHNELDRLMGQHPRRTDEQGNVVASDWVPAVDIKEEPSRFVIYADVPGVDPNAIDVHMEKGMLSISGERQAESDEQRKSYKRMERARGTFLRRFSLPDTADPEKIGARCRNGVLEITIPKHDAHQRRKITVE